jgi:protein TonB
MMLAYAASRPAAARRQSSPQAMLLIVSAHVALLAAVMSAKMDLPQRLRHGPPLIKVRLDPPPPPARPLPPQRQTLVTTHPVYQPEPIVRTATEPSTVETAPGPITGPSVAHESGLANVPEPPQPPPTAPIHRDARLLTPASDLRPPYPASKLASEEEATLRLRLTINEQGRVVAVDPIGLADAAFLDSARRYMIAHWRYAPATDDGRPISTTLVVTLRFQLDG